MSDGLVRPMAIEIEVIYEVLRPHGVLVCVCVALLTSTMRIYFQTIYGQSRVVFKTCPEKWSREVHLGDFNLVLVKIFDLHIIYSSGNRMEVTYFEIAVV